MTDEGEQHRAAVLHFKSNEYVKALSIFNQLIYKQRQTGLKNGKGKLSLSTLLDQRAATHEKMGQSNLALKDARKIMEIEPANCKGYLRTGKLLCLMNRKFDAYKVYQEGIYVISKLSNEGRADKDEKLFLSLKQQYRVLNAELKADRGNSQPVTKRKTGGAVATTTMTTTHQPAKRQRVRNLDPCRCLPLEIMELIFHNLSDRERSLCLLVSKKWHQTLTAFASFFKFDCKRAVTVEEFANGVKFFKRLSTCSARWRIKQLKVNQVARQKISHILHSLICEPSFPVESLDISDALLNLQMLYAVLAKNSWRLNNFHRLRSLKLGINCSMKYPHILLQLFPKLDELEICIILPEHSKMSLLPINDRKFKLLKENRRLTHHLKKLTLVNHTKLLKSEGVAITASTYSPFPVLIDQHLPELVELKLVSFQFGNHHLPEFGTFLASLDQLKSLYLENNDGLNLLTLLQMFLNYNPKFRLLHFTFRENCIYSAMSLQQISASYLTQLTELNTLDLFGNCLTKMGLLKLLKICGKSLTSLNIGNSSYITFELHNPSQLHMSQVSLLCPDLEALYLHEMNIDSSAMLQITKHSFNGDTKLKWKQLDLSFNQFDGVDLMKFLEELKKHVVAPLEDLYLHGSTIQEDMLAYVRRRKFALNCSNDPQRARWRVYGVNSWIL
ncbi:uncharacterized protein LODBEIA_P21280 [Lodderomyces beijingensis]|uniref:F-box domain-containing protein n=1 Tax=Lodderomyces beijingensis TaxID=1775926 RepID=A0ABP0ZIB2_9ASCO